MLLTITNLPLSGLYEENKRRQGETRSQTGFFAVEANG